MEQTAKEMENTINEGNKLYKEHAENMDNLLLGLTSEERLVLKMKLDGDE